jgi:hypothetical protein
MRVVVPDAFSADCVSFPGDPILAEAVSINGFSFMPPTESNGGWSVERLDAGQTVSLFRQISFRRQAACGINVKDIPSLVERNHEVTIKSVKGV